MGALTPFFYTMREREQILDLFEMVCGVRMNYGYFRVGGLYRDVPDEFVPAARAFLDSFPKMIEQYERLFAKNDIFLHRTKGVGILTPRDGARPRPHRVRACVPAACRSTCARPSPTAATRTTTSTSPPTPRGTC